MIEHSFPVVYYATGGKSVQKGQKNRRQPLLSAEISANI